MRHDRLKMKKFTGVPFRSIVGRIGATPEAWREYTLAREYWWPWSDEWPVV